MAKAILGPNGSHVPVRPSADLLLSTDTDAKMQDHVQSPCVNAILATLLIVYIILQKA